MNQTSNSLVRYQRIGMLFYAIAACDNVVKQEEYEALIALVLEEWKSLGQGQDELGSNAVQQMHIVFTWLDYEDLEANDCFDDFEEYFLENSQLFSKVMIDLIYKTARCIAGSFNTINTSEHKMLAQLNMLLHNN